VATFVMVMPQAMRLPKHEPGVTYLAIQREETKLQHDHDVHAAMRWNRANP